jgi:hypothetical protein
MENDGFALVEIDYAGMKSFLDEKSQGYIEAAREAGVIK